MTLRDVAGRRRGRWMAGSLGLPPAGTAADLLAAFDPADVTAEPTTFTGL